ncbi:MAG: radical SAM protein [Planctomycetia bacterium]|nr:radical SAM protein [Planctomycetia bacterium]
MVSRVGHGITTALLKRTRVASTESGGVVTTTLTGPLGIALLEMETWRERDRKIVCKVSGPLKGLVRDGIDAFLAVIDRLKIIAEVDGKNVYNLYNPPMPSAAAMRPFERKIRTMAEEIVFPATATLSITANCHCRCVHCSADRFISPDKRELTLHEMYDVIDQTLELGVCSVVFTGGEPMWRSDLFDMISYVDKNRAHVLIFTNGLLLTVDNVRRLKDAGLGALNVSIDSDSPVVHDRLRRVPGCFDKAMAGAKRAREAGILTGISTYASHGAIASGRLEHLLQIGQAEGFHEVTIFDCVPSGKFLSSPQVRLGRKDIKRVRALAYKYNAMDHPMGVTAQAKVNAYDGGGCFGGFTQFYMTCFGDIDPCDFNPISFGNVRERPLAEIWRKMVSHPEYAAHRMCCRMQSERYRAKYISAIGEKEQLPVSIDRLPGDGRLL